MFSGFSLIRRLPYEGLIFGPSIAVLALLYGATWPARVAGVVFGVGVSSFTLWNAPRETAARNASRARKRRAARKLELEDDSD